MNKILILKNDRVGDLFHAAKGINSILNEHKDCEIEIGEPGMYRSPRLRLIHMKRTSILTIKIQSSSYWQRIALHG